MTRAEYIASFIGHQAGQALFIGLYKVGTTKSLSNSQFWKMPEYISLKQFGMKGISPDRKSVLWFDLTATPFRSDWKGKLIVQWPGMERVWCRWASKEKNVFRIVSILQESLLDRDMPDWHQLTVRWKELAVLPQKWKDALAQWRGIYFILDSSDGKGYVGAAYGRENILGRWTNYSKSGHGGNTRLRSRDPDNLRFSILQRVSPDMESDDVQRLEASWKDRLHTREFGLNDN
jgi:hypothetical protein